MISISKTFLSMACLVPALVAGAGAAHAQSTMSLVAGQSISTDGLTFTVSGSCTYGVFSAGTLTQPGCSSLPSGDVLGVVVNGSGASFELYNTNGGAVISAVSNGAAKGSGSANYTDLKFSVTVTPTVPGSKTTVSSVSATMAGTETTSGGGSISTNLNDLTGGLTVTDNTTSQLHTATTGNAAGVSIGPLSFTASNNLTLSFDLNINTAGVTNGTTLTLTNTTPLLSPAPEPTTMALLLPAGFVLSQIRRKRRRQ